MIVCSTITPNAKVGVLIDLVSGRALSDHHRQRFRHLASAPDYLARVTAPLADPKVGLVTCLYRAVGDTFAARFEALGVATDFAPSALVARLVGVDEFAMGSTLAFRRADLEKIGGFESFSDYLADDYQLGHRLHSSGLKCVLSDVVVETHLGGNWRDVWQHQIRWARTIRVSKFWGYLGLPVTFATFWALGVCGDWRAGAGAACVAHDDGDRRGKKGRAADVFPDPGEGSFWRRGVDGGAVRKHGGVARAEIAVRPRRTHYVAVS